MYFNILPASTPLFRQGGRKFGKVSLLKLKMTTKRPCARQQTESVQRNAPRLTGGTPATRPRMTAICRPAEVPPLQATHRIPLIARRPLFRGRLAGPKHALLRQVPSSGFDVDGNLSIDPACRCQLRSIQPFTFPRFGFVRVLEPQMRHFSRSFRCSAFKKAISQNRL